MCEAGDCVTGKVMEGHDGDKDEKNGVVLLHLRLLSTVMLVCTKDSDCTSAVDHGSEVRTSITGRQKNQSRSNWDYGAL